MIKGALFDIDDTLYSHEIKAVPKATLKALDKLRAKGIRIGICTSRVIAEMDSLPEELLKRIDCQIMGTGAITVVNERYFKSYTIDETDARSYCDYFTEHQISYHYTDINGDIYYWGDLEKVNKGLWLSYAAGKVKFKPYEGEEITNLFYYDAADEDIGPIASINPQAKISHWGNYGNICAPLVDKSFGLLKFCQVFSLTTDEVVACGDGGNDDVMLEMAGIGIAVKNAKENTKAAADYVCHKSIEDGGLYDAFVDLKLIEEDHHDIRMFVFDNDSTLYDHGFGGVHESTYLALEQLKAKGYKLVLNTSRSLAECKNIPKRLLDLMDVKILLNGSLVIKEGRQEDRYLLKEDVDKLIAYFAENDITYRYCLKGGSGYLNRHDEEKEALFKRLYDMIPPVKKYEGERVTHILYYAIGQQREEIISLAEKEENCRLGISGEVSAPGCSKGKTMLEVAEEYGIRKEEICAFGDSGNDITMLKMAGLGIAVGNGSKEARLAADYVCEKISEDGICKALKHFNFIEG